MIATTINYQKLQVWRAKRHVYIAISGFPLSQSPGVSFFALSFALGVVVNPRFAVGIVILSVVVPETSISAFGGHIAISGYRSLSQSLGGTLFGLANRHGRNSRLPDLPLEFRRYLL